MNNQDDNEKMMTPEESLALISKVMAEARGAYRKFSFHFLWWGSLMMVQGIFEWTVLNFYHSAAGNLGWGVFGVIGGFGSMMYVKKQYVASPPTDHDSFYNAMWMAYGLTIFTIIITGMMNKTSPTIYIMIVTGLPTFLTGQLTKFLPFQLGGLSFFVLGLAAALTDPKDASLWFSASMLTGYLIPGILFRVGKENVI